MISVEKCREYLGDEISDERIIEIREALYNLTEQALDQHLFGVTLPPQEYDKN